MSFKQNIDSIVIISIRMYFAINHEVSQLSFNKCKQIEWITDHSFTESCEYMTKIIDFTVFK